MFPVFERMPRALAGAFAAALILSPITATAQFSDPGVGGFTSGGAISTSSPASANFSVIILPSPDIRDDQFSVAFQIDSAHTGATTFDAGFKPPLKTLWALPSEGPMGYPLIARGKVFVWVSHGPASNAGRLYAIDRAAGTVAWQADVAALNGYANLAYDRGFVFVATYDGTVQAFVADTGAPQWSMSLPGPAILQSPPTAAHGQLHVVTDNPNGGLPFPNGSPTRSIFGIDEVGGTIVWSKTVPGDGGLGVPALSLSGEGVFVTFACEVYKFEPTQGTELEHSGGGCVLSSGQIPVYYRGRLYDTAISGLTSPGTSSSVTVLDGATLSAIGSFGGNPSNPILGPVLKGNARYYIQGGKLFAELTDTGDALWSIADPQPSTYLPPLVINDTVFVFTTGTGRIFAFDRATGAQTWTNVASPVPASLKVSPLVAGMAAGEGTLVVPYGRTLYALVPDHDGSDQGGSDQGGDN